MSSSSPWTVLAHLLRPQGRKGELLAELLTDFPERLTAHPHLFLAAPGFTGPAKEARPATVTGLWHPVGKNQGRIVLALAGIDSISQAEPLGGLDLILPTAERAPLEAGTEYIDDLIGCTVFDRSQELGTVQSVQFSTAPDGRRLPDVAPLLTVVTNAGDEVLIPFVEAFLVRLETSARRIELTLPPGLVELNLSRSAAEK